MRDSGERRHSLDGLRGLAALLVVAEHLSAFLPLGYWQVGSGSWGEILSGILDFPFRSGEFAVYVFFVISGYVIAASARRYQPWPSVLLSRYLRLTVPMVFALLLAAALFHIFPNMMPAVFSVNPNHWSAYETPPPSFSTALADGLWGEYLFGDHSINSVIWSMRVELFGSWGIYTFYRFVREDWRIPALCVLVLLISVTNISIYMNFPLGALLMEADKRGRLMTKGSVALLCAGLALGIVGKFHRPIPIMSAGAVLIVLGALTGKLRSALSTAVPGFLGRISYSLYLTHLPVLYSVFAYLYLACGHPPSHVILMPWLAAFCAAELAIAWWMTVWVDEPASRLIKKSGRDAAKAAWSHRLAAVRGRPHPIAGAQPDSKG
jgi:peptidoglycan/LPS O-acetylase OafA/YrhL